MKNINIRTVQKVDNYNSFVSRYLRFKKKNYLTPEEQKKIRKKFGKITNEMRSAVEVYKFKKQKPKTYFLYVDIKNRNAITWTGQKLGKIFAGCSYRSNFGDMRTPIDVVGINGVKYHGFYFQSAGDYARITAYKNQS